MGRKWDDDDHVHFRNPSSLPTGDYRHSESLSASTSSSRSPTDDGREQEACCGDEGGGNIASVVEAGNSVRPQQHHQDEGSHFRRSEDAVLLQEAGPRTRGARRPPCRAHEVGYLKVINTSGEVGSQDSRSSRQTGWYCQQSRSPISSSSAIEIQRKGADGDACGRGEREDRQHRDTREDCYHGADTNVTIAEHKIIGMGACGNNVVWGSPGGRSDKHEPRKVVARVRKCKNCSRWKINGDDTANTNGDINGASAFLSDGSKCQSPPSPTQFVLSPPLPLSSPPSDMLSPLKRRLHHESGERRVGQHAPIDQNTQQQLQQKIPQKRSPWSSSFHTAFSSEEGNIKEMSMRAEGGREASENRAERGGEIRLGEPRGHPCEYYPSTDGVTFVDVSSVSSGNAIGCSRMCSTHEEIQSWRIQVRKCLLWQTC